MSNAIVNLIRRLKRCLRDGISFILYLFIFWKKRRGTVTLVYHSVYRACPSEDLYRVNITPEKFEEHLKVISKSRDDITITFDDGYGNNFKNAFPLLKKYGCAADIFLITDFIDGAIKSKQFCGEGLDMMPLTWDEIRIMDNFGITFGSHTKTHPALSTLSCDAIRVELLDSKRRIEAMLGHSINGFSYPFGNHGSFNVNVTKIVAETGYGYAYTNIMGVNKGDSKNNYALRRVRIYSEDGPLKLRMKLKGAYDWVDALNTII